MLNIHHIEQWLHILMGLHLMSYSIYLCDDLFMRKSIKFDLRSM